MKVLDAGCGPGRLTVPLAWAVGRAGEVVALDTQRAMRDITPDKTRAEFLDNVRLIVAQLDRDKLPGTEFDRAVMVNNTGLNSRPGYSHEKPLQCHETGRNSVHYRNRV